MTKLLEEAFAKAASLSPEEQDVIATRLLAELSAENEFDRAIEGSGDKIAGLARKALDEHQRGLTQELDPDRL